MRAASRWAHLAADGVAVGPDPLRVRRAFTERNLRSLLEATDLMEEQQGTA